MRKNNKNKRGFIALFSVIIITSILLLIAGSLSFSGFFGRLNVYDSELKKESDALAYACINHAVLEIAKNSSFSQGSPTVVDIGEDLSCNLYKVENSGGEATVYSGGEMGTGRKAYTYYISTVDTSTFEITSLKETKDDES